MSVTPPRTLAAIATALALVSIISVFIAQRSHGVARDEIDYMGAGKSYAAFWSNFWRFKKGVRSETNITRHFGGASATANNREHPPLLKTMFGFSHNWLHKGAGMGKISAYRVPTMVFNALLVVLVFLFVASIWGLSEGLVAALLTLFLPRAFFHAGLATFDAAVVTTWMATIFAYYKALDSRRWCLVLGVVYGLALATKHNAIFLPVPMIVHYVVVCYLDTNRQRASGDSRSTTMRAFGRCLLTRRPLIVFAFAIVGPIVLVALWPWLWFDTIEHARAWIAFHLKHVHYNYEYLGENWNAPPFPWHVPIVTTLLTVPVATLAAGIVGAVVLLARARRGRSASPGKAPALLLFLSAGVAMGPFILRTTPIFGAEKHFAAAMPTITAFAGIGVMAAARHFVARAILMVSKNSPWERRFALGVPVIVAVAVVAAAVVETAVAQPHALSHYSALAGGAPGGADLGMNRQFWGVSAYGVLPVINRYAEDGATTIVYAHDADKAFGLYRSVGLLEKKTQTAPREEVGIRRSQIAIVVHELHFNRHDYLIWKAYGTVKPVFVLRAQGVPIVSVYVRPQRQMQK